MLESQIVNNSLSIVDLAKGIKKEILLEFAKDYLNKHVYISSKKLATAYLHEYYNLSHRDIEYTRIRKTLSHRFRHIIMLLTQERLIVGYNNSSLYKRVDIPIIDKSLSNDSTKLIYYQGKFVNPKFYDI